MATETGLTKVNVFSSKASYEANKASIGSDEISLIKGETSTEVVETIHQDNQVCIKYGDGTMTIQGYNPVGWGIEDQTTFIQPFSEINFPPLVGAYRKDSSAKFGGAFALSYSNTNLVAHVTNDIQSGGRYTFLAVGKWK